MCTWNLRPPGGIFRREEAQHRPVWHKPVAADVVARHVSSHMENLPDKVRSIVLTTFIVKKTRSTAEHKGVS